MEYMPINQAAQEWVISLCRVEFFAHMIVLMALAALATCGQSQKTYKNRKTPTSSPVNVSSLKKYDFYWIYSALE